MTLRIMPCAIAAALALTAAGHASAEPVVADAVSVRVDLNDLDLQKNSGMKQAMSRIEAAAVQVCGGRPDIRRLEDVQAYNECHRQTVTGATERLQTVAASGQKSATYAIAIAR